MGSHSSALAQDSSGIHVAPLWTVHIDQVEPAKVMTFERLCREQSRMRQLALSTNGIAVPLSYEIELRGTQYFTFRPRETYAELDHPPAYPDSVRKKLDREVYSLDDSIHATLKEHYSQLWSYDESSSYIPPAWASHPKDIQYVHIHTETVRPGEDNAHDSVLAALHAALNRAHYQLPVLIFYASYGAGGYQYLWFADSVKSMLSRKILGDIMRAAFDSVSVRKFHAQWNRSLLDSKETDARVRRELNALDPRERWFGLAEKK